MKLTKKFILVTGGAGFIGSNLCKSLLKQGHNVIAVDNLITGNINNLKEIFDNKQFNFFHLDITEPLFTQVFKNIKIEQIYHLACPTGVPNIKKYGEEMVLTCSLGTINVMEIAKLHQAKLLYTSSAEVYGQPERTPQDENYTGNVNPIGPRSPYEEGKRFSESVLKMYSDKYNMDVDIVRIFNTYGPGMSLSDQRVMPRFVNSIIKNKNFTIYGDGEQTRTFCYIDDLIHGLVLVMQEGNKGEIYNIGGDKQVSIKELALLMKQISGSQNEINYVPHFIEDHRHRQPSTEKVKKLGWQQKISLAEGLKKMLAANNIK